MLTTFPQYKLLPEFQEILGQNHMCYHRLSASGNSTITHCGILMNMPFFISSSVLARLQRQHRLHSTMNWHINREIAWSGRSITQFHKVLKEIGTEVVSSMGIDVKVFKLAVVCPFLFSMMILCCSPRPK